MKENLVGKNKVMKKAIYKIQNKINKKIYIGQSKDPEKRFKEYSSGQSGYISLIEKAILKYGVENFTFEILGWFEDYNKKEKEFISYYRSLVPGGYNILPGGNNPPLLQGENHPNASITLEIAKAIQKDLLNHKIAKKQIMKKYNVSADLLRHMIVGDSWRDESLQYPLRPLEREINNRKVEEVIKLLQTTSLSQKEIGKKVGWSRSAITMINIGKNHYNPNIIYPIRK